MKRIKPVLPPNTKYVPRGWKRMEHLDWRLVKVTTR